MNELIAIIDDEPDIVELVSVNLKKVMFKVKGFNNAGEFYKFLEEQSPDLVILDLMLPDADGLEICKYISKEARLSSVHIIMLTAKTDEVDKILGLEFGADDYVTKPFSPKELVARVKAICEEGGEVDSLYEQIYQELLTFMIEGQKTIIRVTYLTWAAHNLERLADRVTNICERIVFLVTGTIEEINVLKH